MIHCERPTRAPDVEFDTEETARRRDEVVRRMANTTPQPQKASNRPRRGKKKPSDAGLAYRRSATVANERGDG